MFAEAPPPAVFLEGPPGRIQVQGSNAILGRDPRSPIPLTDPGVSYTHAEIVVAGPSVYVRDLGSATGTWVNGAPVTAPKVLRDGDRLRVGGTELVVRIQAADGARMSIAAPSAQRTGEPKPHLDVRTGRSLGLGFELVKSPTTIGRDPSALIRLDDESIDWQHASVRQSDRGWEIADAESHGVTKKNGTVLPPSQWFALESGDVIEVGDVVMVYVVRPPDAHAGLFAPQSVAYESAMGGGRPSAMPPATPSQIPHAMPSQMPHAMSRSQMPPAPAPSSPSQMPPSPYGAIGFPAIRGPSQAPPAYTPSAYPPPPQHPTIPPAFAVRVPMRGRISVRHGPGQGSFAELGDVTVIGNQPGQASLVLADPRLGPRHVEISRQADGFYVRDLGTTWGTQRRGERLGPTPTKLAHGDELVLGPAVILLFEASA
jgi:pSer/pThr/pTyr-binding forkhead associated (FHA) protein